MTGSLGCLYSWTGVDWNGHVSGPCISGTTGLIFWGLYSRDSWLRPIILLFMYHPSIHIDYTHFRYASRCLMMEFSPPALSLGLTDYMELAETWEGCTTCVGFCVSLGQKFFSSGIKEVDKTILPHLTALAGSDVHPRVLPSYSTLYWFSLQVRSSICCF